MYAGRKWGALSAALLLTGALTLVACGAESGGTTKGVKTDKGVTSEPCPGSTNTDRGCIYLGLLSDLTTGPFAPLAVEIVRGQRDFWARVNANGGIGGKFDVNVTRYTRDNKYNPEEHVAKLRQIEPHILALGQSLGTATTLAGLDIMKRDDLIASPATWWSGWAFDDDNTVLESGYSYCLEAMNGLDYMAQRFGKPKSVLAVGYPGDYGGDSAAGVTVWGKQNDATVKRVQTAPNAQAGNQDAVVNAIRQQRPDVVMLATGPAESAEIVGKAVASGFTGEFIGAIPTFNPALLKTKAGQALRAKFRYVSPWAPFGANTPAHDAMRQAVGDKLPRNEGYTFGWIWSYPIKAALEQAVRDGDLTRKGVHATVGKITVDYEGALPDRRYGDPDKTVVREAVIARLDPKAPLGTSLEKGFFTGPTAKSFKITKPCASAG